MAKKSLKCEDSEGSIKKIKNTVGFLKSRKGAVAVMTAIIFISTVFFTSVMYEAGARKAAETELSAACENAGRVILSCYDRQLFERYGIFAYELRNDEISDAMEVMIKKSLKAAPSMDVTITDLNIDKNGFSIENLENFEVQIRKIGKKKAVNNAFEKFSGYFRNIATGIKDEKNNEKRRKHLENQFNEERKSIEEGAKCIEAEDESQNTDYGAIDNIHSELKDITDSAGSMLDEGTDDENRVLRNGKIRDSLPSVRNGVSQGSSFSGIKDAFSMDFLSAAGESFFADEYISEYFTNHSCERNEDSFFRNEAEYILKGGFSDIENYRGVIKNIFTIRTVLNAAYLYSDSGKRNITLEAANMLTPGPFAPLTQILITGAWSAAEALNDVKNLENGNGVPLIKNDESWMTDLDGILESGNMQGYIEITCESDMDYSEYVRILLMVEKKSVKLYRMMDLIQINMKGSVRKDFVVSDHFAGFAVSSGGIRNSHAAGIPDMKVNASMAHMYIKDGKM